MEMEGSPPKANMEDLQLFACLVELVGVRGALCKGTTTETFMHTLANHFSVKTEDAKCGARLVVRCLRLLRASGKSREDLEVIGAHATSYVSTLQLELRREGKPSMRLREFVYVLCVLLYIAHSYTEDVHVPLRYWHKHIFVDYCNMKTLNAAILGLLAKLNYKLRVHPRELRARMEFLQRSEALCVAATRKQGEEDEEGLGLGSSPSPLACHLELSKEESEKMMESGTEKLLATRQVAAVAC
jgi:hypothetical protein